MTSSPNPHQLNISGTSARDGSQAFAIVNYGSLSIPDIDHRQRSDDLLKQLPCAVEAPFNTYIRRNEPTCLPNTRSDLLREIYAWADGHDERIIYWLNGLAGPGKTTIARTVARKYSDNGQLGASFFFSTGGRDVNNARKFFTTIALQLAKKSQHLRRHIIDALGKNSDIATQSLSDQWRQLVLVPLSMLNGNSYSSSYIFVIDALDECDNDEDIRTILQLLTEAQSLETVRLRVFLTSRPEVPIRHSFCQIPEARHQIFVLHNISSSVVDHDITTFLEYNLRLIREESSLKDGRPGEKIIKCLVQNANGLFIWAATACRFIRQGKRIAARRLAMILENSTQAIKAPEKHLNEIYITVLRNSVFSDYDDEEKEEIYGMLRYILGSVVILSSPLSPYTLGKLLHVSNEEVDQTLNNLHAILEVPKDRTGPLRLHHPSFRDFLLDKGRCNDSDFWVDEKRSHQRLAANCIQLLSMSLKEDICNATVPGTLIDDIERSRVYPKKSDNDEVDKFLRDHALHWLEALGWMQKLSEGILEIMSLEFIARAADCPNLHAFIRDMRRFALHNKVVMKQYPLQIYSSALLFTPMMSIVRRQFACKVPSWIKRGPEVETTWSPTLQILEAHSGIVSAIAFSPNGKQLVSGSDDKTVRVWDAATGAALQLLEGHSSAVEALALSPDGKQLVSASSEEMRVCDTATAAVVQILERRLRAGIAVALSPDGKQLASGSFDKIVRVWDTATGEKLQVFHGHLNTVSAVAFSNDGKHLSSGSKDSTVRLWETTTRATPHVLKGHSETVCSLAFSPDGRQLASGSFDQTVRVWDTATGGTIQTLEGHWSSVYALAFSPDGTHLASGSGDKTVRVWDTATGETLHIFTGHLHSIKVVVFSGDGKQLASGSDDRTVRLWDTATRATQQTFQGHSQRVFAVAFSPDGKQLASASFDKTVRLWDTATEAKLQIFRGHSDIVFAVAFSPDGKLLASGSGDYTVRFWDAATGATVQILQGHSSNVRTVAFSPDGRQLASGSQNGTVRVWDLATGTTVQILQGHSSNARTVAFSPDGRQLASGSQDETVRVWDLASGAALEIFDVLTNVKVLSYSSDGSIVMNHRKLDTRDYATSSSIPTPSFPKSPPSWLPISVDYEWISHGSDRMLRLHPDRRTSCSAVHEGLVCIGYMSGGVSTFEFAFPLCGKKRKRNLSSPSP